MMGHHCLNINEMCIKKQDCLILQLIMIERCTYALREMW